MKTMLGGNDCLFVHTHSKKMKHFMHFCRHVAALGETEHKIERVSVSSDLLLQLYRALKVMK